jgi:type I restriction enzyme S subunit
VRDHEVSFELGRRHDAKAKKVDPERHLRMGDVLVNSTGTGTLGRVAQLRTQPPEPTTVDTHVTIVRPEQDLFYPDFFGYMLIQIEDEIARSGEGASGQTELARSTLQNKFMVSFPTSLSEQQRIVAILDEAFAGLAAATANAEKNIKNARELFDSYLNSVFEENSETWETRSLKELCEDNRVITYGVIKLGKEIPDGVPCLRTSNVRWLHIDIDGIKRILPSLSNEYRRTILRGGEVLVNVRGTLGGVAVAASEMKGWNVSREVAVVPVDAGRIEPSYLAYFVATRRSQNWLTDVQKGLAYVGINIADLRTLPISLPDRKVQNQLIKHFEKLSGESRRLEAIYVKRLSQIDELREALLQKAFSGELTSPPSQSLREAAE